MAAIQLCLITDRRAFGSDPDAIESLVDLARDASAAGIDWIQLREKDLPARALVHLAGRLVVAASVGAARVSVNDRFDVSLAAGAAGVHLTTRSLSPWTVRLAVGSRLVIGVSTHSETEVRSAALEHADYVVCGPVSTTPSKAGLGEPLGTAEVARIARDAGIPVLALGGVDEPAAVSLIREGVPGIAAIRLFQEAWKTGGSTGLERVVGRLRSTS